MHFERLAEPLLRPYTVPAESQGVEDPRVIKMGDTLYMIYTAYDLQWAQIALATSKDLVNWRRQGIIIGHELFGHNKDSALFPE